MGAIVAFAGALPAVFFMWLVERFDAKRPEPKVELRKVAFLGGVATLPCIALQLLIDPLKPDGVAGALYTAYLSAALTEETAKALALYLAVWRSPHFDERLDGIVYATRAGLGFALVENIGYLLGTESVGGFLGVFVLRAVLAVPGHAIYAGFMGYWVARRRFDQTGPGLLGGLAIAILLHGTYDAALFLVGVVGRETPGLILPLIVVPFAVVGFGYLRLKAHANEALRLDELTHAPRPRRLPLGMGFLLR